jgi:hypothetical protein
MWFVLLDFWRQHSMAGRVKTEIAYEEVRT